MKKKIPIPTNEPKNQYGRFYYDIALVVAQKVVDKKRQERQNPAI